MIIAMRIHILALNGVFDTGLAAVLDAFGTANALAEMTGISSLRFQIKVLGDGELSHPLTVHAHKFSKSAEEKITRAGGKVELLS